MRILCIRTDKPEAEVGLFADDTQLAYETWYAHRALSETIHTKIEALLMQQHKTFKDIDGIVCFEGPGSFTGLRIGMSVANTLAYALHVPIIATAGEDWIATGTAELRAGKGMQTVLPVYGMPAHTTVQKQ